MNVRNENKSRVKRAELLSGVGAVVLGIGLGVLLSSFLKPYALPVLITGLVMHALGMFMMHKFENESTTVRLWWAEILYWLCWIILLGIIIYVAVDYLRT
jgi:flagellar biosynthesis protein FlhB